MLSEDRIAVSHETLGKFELHLEGSPLLLFTENQTNAARVFGAADGNTYVKDAFHEYVIQGNVKAVRPEAFGTKACGVYALELAGGEQRVIQLRLASNDAPPLEWARFSSVFTDRIREADQFY